MISELAASLTVADLLRFFDKIEQDGDCLVWTGYRNPGGYGQVRIHGRTLLAHRVAYEIAGDPIPSGLTLDHLCRKPSCVQPSHLEPVTNRTNVLRGIGPTAVNARKERCPQDHLLDPENVYLDRDGSRRCRICHREHQRRYQARRRP